MPFIRAHGSRVANTIRVLFFLCATAGSSASSVVDAAYLPAPAAQTVKEADTKTLGCMSCHTATDRHTMHQNPAVILGCSDCHGGDARVFRPDGARREDAPYVATLRQAHVLPRNERAWSWPSSATPERTYTLLNRESPQFIRFINPGDLRAAREACGACHLPIIQASERSLMATSAMLWGGAAYNNGILPYKRYLLGEAYTREGQGASIVNPVKPDAFLVSKGILPALTALPSWETIPPADVFRVFERGGRVISSQFPEIGLPNSSGALQKLDEPGRPDFRQSNRGPGTGSRIAVPVINITKTRLNDPHLWFLGTNEQPGDYRSSGCSACHSVYANDRDERHSGIYARFGHAGESATRDPTIRRNEPGHPIRHEFTRAIPSSQCMVCHMHQPNVFVNSFYGTIMWDYESDAPSMWPKAQKYPTSDEARRILDRNPEEAAIRGNWGDPAFLKDVAKLNPTLKDTQFADYHGHGWNFRAVYKRDRKGALLDKDGGVVRDDDPEKFSKGVHLTSIHLDLGFHCVDCHFAQDMHGNGHIYGEVAAAVEIDCADCHGTADKYPTLRTSGPASRPGGMDMSLLRTQDGRKRFEWRGGKLYQRSALDPDLEWDMTLVKDTVTPGNPRYNEKAARAKLMHSGAEGRAGQWGAGASAGAYAHSNEKMTCFSCHLSWTTSCSGCHLPIQANWKTERLHYEGGETRNYATYNPQVARDDIFQLGRHGPVKGGRIAPVRSSSALVLSSTNINRERIYIQQPPVAASGFSSQAFAPHYPHTERKTETKTCSDCHVSAANDNNAIMAQLLLQGTNFVNFVGFNAWLGEERHVEAVQVTEWDEPQAVIGSYLHRYAYPDWFARHEKRSLRLPEAHDHPTKGAVGCLALRGEYLYAAEGAGGMRVYDVASIANKGVSQRIVTAPFSPLGQDTHIASMDDLRGVAHEPADQPAAQRGRADAHRQPGAGVPSDLPLRGDRGCRGRVDPGRCRHARRRRAAQQLPQARAHLESRRRPHRRAPRDPRRALCLLRHRGGYRDRRSRRAARAEDRGARAARRRARECLAVPLSLRRDVGGARGARCRRARQCARGRGRESAPRRCASRLCGAHLCLRGRGAPGSRDRRRGASRRAAALHDVHRGRQARRCPRRDRRLDQRIALRLCRRRQERSEGDPAHRARHPAALLRLQPRATPAARRVARDALERDRARQGPRSRPRGRRDWRADRGLRAHRLAPVHARGAAQVLPHAGGGSVESERLMVHHRGQEDHRGGTEERPMPFIRASGSSIANDLKGLLFLCATSVILMSSVVNAAPEPSPALPYQAKGEHIGVVNCASSLCHGSVSSWKDSNILQNEYVTWSRVDKHATRAYPVLLNERSRRIAANLGLKQPAHQAKLCLDCHAENPPLSQRGERFKMTDGIGCEACHGPAESWIKSHVESGATHADNVAHGLYPANEPVAQARLCLSCHFGNEDQFVTHRMMGAGHPRMSFELDTFSQTQPPHFVIDADWEKRKGSWDPIRVWAIGQALAASELLAVLLDAKRSRDGLFPELVVFDCHACHHPMSDVRWSPRTGTSPGRIRLNDANLLMLRQIVRQALPADDANAFAQRITELHKAVAGDGGDPHEAALALRGALDGVVKRLAGRTFRPADLRAILAGLAEDGLNGQYRDYAGAEQATMAIASLLNFLGKRGELKEMRAANAALDRLYEAVKDDEKFRPERFRAALGELRDTVIR